ncbi:SPASM domain-containing protein [Methanopyrus sp.]
MVDSIPWWSSCGCGAGRCLLAIRPNGDVQPCVFLPVKIGNILRDDRGELWNDDIL